ncbi:hypothetical protein B5C08_01945 [Staphylococcus delphini]|uniref:Uncharacterized protein n=1 Tax=Staphylococcus delphini TaxID=53344 RepID=A0A2A4GZT8_9STAP|nr:hypothetical protein [Staphylococcus delphini]PCF56821.1 hypothetical protein B5C08_01945 [Staphylococcus delphini]
MGLDMYFYLENKDTKEMIEYSYYRKFNALQGYFIKNFDIQNCEKLRITKSNIQHLHWILNELKYSPEKAEQMLPVYQGPFFGSYEYDNIYRNHVQQAAQDIYHAQFIDFNKYHLYFTSNW